MTQVVGRRPFIAEAWVQSQVSLFAVGGGQIDYGMSFRLSA